MEAYYGLPEQVYFCKRCVMSNQRPASEIEFKHTLKTKKRTLHIDEQGICDACRYAEVKEQIDWKNREEQLLRVLDQFRRSDGHYDCLVPGSGGKDSIYAAHILKYKYGMNPLTTTWPPIMYTDYGYRNFRTWIERGGFDNVTYNQNGQVMRLLTKLAIQNLLHPFQTFMLGQKNLAPKIALRFNIPLVFYGENEAEYGNPIADNASSLRDKAYFTFENLNDCYLGGLPVKEIIEKYKVPLADLMTYLPAPAEELGRSKMEVHYLGYYIKWTPQEAYYYAADKVGFSARPFRTQGTYSKYNSIDDKIDDLHYYTTFIKFGLGRATYDASQEIRNKHVTREEAMALVKRFDGEFPDRYFKEIMDYLEMDSQEFMDLCEKFRSPHLWAKTSDGWKLRHTVNSDGVDDPK